MQAFLSHDFDIREICGVYFIPMGMGTKLHQNRKWHGIALNLGEPKKYIYDDRKSVTVGQNEFIYLPKGSSYTVNANQSGNCFSVNFELHSEHSFPSFSWKPRNLSQYMQKWKALIRAYEQKEIGYQMACKALLYEMLVMMETEHQSKYFSVGAKRLISPAVEYIHKHYTDPEITVSLLADICNISRDYLRKLFNEVYHTPPLRYINQLRIAHAEELMTSGLYSISESSMLSGYTDACYFSREFKKHYGVSPKKYLNQFR